MNVFVKKIVFEYLQILGNKLPAKLAFDFNDSEQKEKFFRQQ